MNDARSGLARTPPHAFTSILSLCAHAAARHTPQYSRQPPANTTQGLQQIAGIAAAAHATDQKSSSVTALDVAGIGIHELNPVRPRSMISSKRSGTYAPPLQLARLHPGNPTTAQRGHHAQDAYTTYAYV